MSTLSDRSRTALLVVDVQKGVVAQGHRRDEVVGNIASLVDRARAEDVPVVWVQHHDEQLQEGSEAWQYVDELPQAQGEAVVHKSWGDAFEETELERVLAEAGVGRLVVTGAQTTWCIRSTLHGAIARGYDALLVSDAHTDDDIDWDGTTIPASQIIEYANTYWSWHQAPGRSAGTVAAAEVDFAG